MPKARNRFERSRQVLAWCRSEWPCGRPVRLRWKKEIKDGRDQLFGLTYRDGRGLVIELSKRRCREWSTMNETTIHEYAHAVLWSMANLEGNPKCDDHSPAFWAQYGEMIDRFQHDHGAEQASEFPVR